MADDYELLERAAKERRDIVKKYKIGREEGAQIDPWEDPQFEVYHTTDRFGFIHDHAIPDVPDSLEAKARALQIDRTQKWVKMMKQWDKYSSSRGSSEKLARRVYKGIPHAMRGTVWRLLLALPAVQMEQKGVYENMRFRALEKSPDIRQIDLDVNRTYRNHRMFRERYNEKQKQLFYVLAAYSMYNTEVGYCQGMSQIAALLLMYMNEEDAFWALSTLLTDRTHAMHGFFIPGFPKLMRFQEHHDRVIKRFLPKLKKVLDADDIPSSLYTIKWFLQCFLDRIPFTLTLRIWDIYMLEGEPLLVSMSHNMLKMHRRKLAKMKMEEMITFFQGELERDFGYDDDSVIESLQVCMEELRRAKMDLPPRPKVNELPSLPFGIEIQPSVYAIIGKRTLGDRRSRLLNDAETLNSVRLRQSQRRAKLDTIHDGFSRSEVTEADERPSQNSAMTSSHVSLQSFNTTSRISMAGTSRTSYFDHSDAASVITAEQYKPDGSEDTETMNSYEYDVHRQRSLSPGEISQYDNYQPQYEPNTDYDRGTRSVSVQPNLPKSGQEVRKDAHPTDAEIMPPLEVVHSGASTPTHDKAVPNHGFQHVGRATPAPTPVTYVSIPVKHSGNGSVPMVEEVPSVRQEKSRVQVENDKNPSHPIRGVIKQNEDISQSYVLNNNQDAYEFDMEDTLESYVDCAAGLSGRTTPVVSYGNGQASPREYRHSHNEVLYNSNNVSVISIKRSSDKKHERPIKENIIRVVNNV